MRPSQTGTHTSDKALFQKGLKKKTDQKTEHLPPHCQGFFWNVPPHKKGPKKAFAHKRSKKNLKWEPIRLTRDYPRKVWKKPDQNLPHEKGQKKAFGSKSEKRPWPAKRTPTPTLATHGLELKLWSTIEKGQKKAPQVQKKAQPDVRPAVPSGGNAPQLQLLSCIFPKNGASLQGRISRYSQSLTSTKHACLCVCEICIKIYKTDTTSMSNQALRARACG